jgi:uncharacterized protein YeaO (DUF488 family)
MFRLPARLPARRVRRAKIHEFTLPMNASGSRIAALTKELRQQWQRTRDDWDDAKSHEFEHKFLQELTANVDKSVTVVEELDKLINKIRKDCE